MSDQGELLTGEQIKAAKQHTERMARAVDIGRACTQRVAWAGEHGKHGPTMDEAVEAVAHPLEGVQAKDLTLVIAALAARVAGLETGVDRRAVRAVQMVRMALDEFDRESSRGDVSGGAA